MLRSMFAGVSGLKNHQVRMDVIGNNIANVNTVGYKTSRVTFKDIFSQTVRGASAPQSGRGGLNPVQVGLGMTVGTIDTIHTRGNVETTGKNTDLAIDGDGFFIVKTNGDGALAYTRAGNFDRDRDGYLVNSSSGFKLQGWVPEENSTTGSELILSDIYIPIGSSIPTEPTSEIDMASNLNVTQLGAYRTQIDVIDSLGVKHNLTVSFEKGPGSSNTWTATVGVEDLETEGDGDPATVEWAGDPMVYTLAFKTDGTFDTVTPDSATDPFSHDFANGSDTLNVNVDFTHITQFAGDSAVTYTRNGYGSGELENFSIDATGDVTGHYSNGKNTVLAKIILANFANPAGLEKAGDNSYMPSPNTGSPMRSFANTNGLGSIVPSSLEMSNVDLSQEFTNMIVTQRGFQANSRVITVSDEMLQELVNLKR